jgi:hypothetical protein
MGAPAAYAALQDSSVRAPSDTASGGAKKLQLIKRDYNYRKQVSLALGMMALVLIMMTASQAWNPR